jgi:hypothetical protein
LKNHAQGHPHVHWGANCEEGVTGLFEEYFLSVAFGIEGLFSNTELPSKDLVLLHNALKTAPFPPKALVTFSVGKIGCCSCHETKCRYGYGSGHYPSFQQLLSKKGLQETYQ